jgi:hypothetical protein
MHEFPNQVPEELKGSLIEKSMIFRNDCFQAILETLEMADTQTVGQSALFGVVREKVDSLYGEGTYRWDAIEGQLELLVTKGYIRVTPNGLSLAA